MEYHEMILYASKDVIFSVKAFIENSTRENFLKTILTPRSGKPRPLGRGKRYSGA